MREMREIEIEDGSSLRQIVDRLQPNDGVVLTRAGERVARLKAEPRRLKVRLGLARGQFTLPDDFDAPLPEDVLALFYESRILSEQPPADEDVPGPKNER